MTYKNYSSSILSNNIRNRKMQSSHSTLKTKRLYSTGTGNPSLLFVCVCVNTVEKSDTTYLKYLSTNMHTQFLQVHLFPISYYTVYGSSRHVPRSFKGTDMFVFGMLADQDSPDPQIRCVCAMVHSDSISGWLASKLQTK